MPLSFGCKAIFRELEKKEERKAWERWLVDYGRMDKDNYTSFEEYLRKLKNPISQRPKEDILAEVERIRESVRDKEIS